MAVPLIIKRGAWRLLLQEELDYIFSQGLVFPLSPPTGVLFLRL